jgi:DHA1 family inner membrane transport protein
MGLLTQVSQDLHISIPTAGTLISGYAVGVAVGAPVLTLASRRWPRKLLLLSLMLLFIAGNAAAALAPSYGWLLAARVLTSLTHGTFFGVGAVVATQLVAPEKKGLGHCTDVFRPDPGHAAGRSLRHLDRPALGLAHGFASVSGIGVIALLILLRHVPRELSMPSPQGLTQELAVLRNGAMWRGLLLTVIGFAGVFTLYTYIEPLLTQITGMDNRMIAFTLLLFGAGLALGNHAGGKLADRFGVQRAVGVAGRPDAGADRGPLDVCQHALAIAFVLLLGIAAFATSRRCRWVCCNRGRSRHDSGIQPQYRGLQSGQCPGCLAGRSRDCTGPEPDLAGLGCRHAGSSGAAHGQLRATSDQSSSDFGHGGGHALKAPKAAQGGSLPSSSADQFPSKATARSPFCMCSSSAWFLHQFRSHGKA